MLKGPVHRSRVAGRENAWPRAVAHRSRVYSRSAYRWGTWLLARRGAIERQVERQHAHPRLAQEAEGTTLDMLLDELPHAIFRQIAGFRNSGDLEKGRFGRNVWIEAAAGGRTEFLSQDEQRSLRGDHRAR